MHLKRFTFSATLLLIVCGLLISPALAKGPSLEKWKPAFDPSGAKYKFIVSNVSHPVLKGVYTGFAIRDELWKRTVLDSGLHEGHGIWLADLTGEGGDQIIACSRAGGAGPGRGVFVYAQNDDGAWGKHVIDDKDMAAEDIAAADLDGDGRVDIVAVGRATHNVRIYWNQK